MTDPTPRDRKLELLERGVIDIERGMLELRSSANGSFVQVATDLHEVKLLVQQLDARLTQVMRYGGGAILLLLVMLAVLCGVIVERKIPDRATIAAPSLPIQPTRLFSLPRAGATP